MTGGERPAPLFLSQQNCVAGGSLSREVPGWVASGPDQAMACRNCQTTRVWRAWRKGIREKPAFYASQRRTGSNLADLGRRRRAPVSLIYGGGELPGMSAGGWGGRGDVLRGSHGDVAGAESGASSAERSTSEHGNHPWFARMRRGQRCISGRAHRRPSGQGWGGAVVVVAGVTTCRGGRESRSQGEGRQWFREASERVGGCNAERCATEW